MAVTEKQLKSRIAKFVISAEIHQCGRARLRGERALRPVVEDLGAKSPFLSDIALHQPSREREIAIAGNTEDRCTAAAIGSPGAKAFLGPNRNLVPGLSDAEPSGSAAGRNLEHGKCADHRKMLALLHETILDPEFCVSNPEGAWTIRRKDGCGVHDHV